MEYKNKILEYLDEKITKINESKEENIDNILISSDYLEKLLTKLKKLRELPEKERYKNKELQLEESDFNIELLAKINELDKDKVDFLKKTSEFLKSIFSNKYKDKTLDKLIKIINEFQTILSTKIEKNQELNNKIDIILKLKDKIFNDYENIFQNGSINELIELWKQDDMTKIEIMELIDKIMKDFNTPSVTNIDDEQEELQEEIIEVNADENIINKIRKIFEDYGYPEIERYYNQDRDLFRLGKPDKIEGILKVFKKYNFNLLDIAIKENYLTEKNNQLEKIFIYSDEEVVEAILSLASNSNIGIYKYENGELIKNEDGTPKINFNFLLERPSRFIKRKRRYSRNQGQPIEIDINSDNIGIADDFIKNINFFSSQGINIPKIFEEFNKIIKNNPNSTKKPKGTYFDIPHQNILQMHKALVVYGITPNIYQNALSCFSNNDAIDALDQFIELNLKDYIKINLSRITIKPDDPIFYRIVKLYQDAIKRDKTLITKRENAGIKDKLDEAKNFMLTDSHEYDKDGNLIRGRLQGFIINHQKYMNEYAIGKISKEELKRKEQGMPPLTEEEKKELLNKYIRYSTGINKTNGASITQKYKRESVLSEYEVAKFKQYDEVIKKNINFGVKEGQELQVIKAFDKWFFRTNSTTEVYPCLSIGIRISRNKFYRIFNTLFENGCALEALRECLLYSFTYNSILTEEQFNQLKKYIYSFCKEYEKSLVTLNERRK